MSFLHTDIPDLRGYDTGLVLSNLAYLGRRHTDIGEATLAELWELAAAIRLDAGGDQDTEDSILLSLQDQPQEETTLEAVPTLPGEDRTWHIRCRRPGSRRASTGDSGSPG